MARQKNSVDSVQITVSVTEQVRDQLENLTSTGLFGKNVADTANIFISERIREIVERQSPILALPAKPA
jgi:Arc/MetJ-type ribon-helix-helix transcriptional regulator